MEVHQWQSWSQHVWTLTLRHANLRIPFRFETRWEHLRAHSNAGRTASEFLLFLACLRNFTFEYVLNVFQSPEIGRDPR